MKAFYLSLFTGDIGCALVAIYLGILLSLRTFEGTNNTLAGSLPSVVLIVLLLFMSSFAAEVYDHDRVRGKKDLVASIMLSVAMSFIVLGCIDYFMDLFHASQWFVICAILSFAVLQFAWHNFFLVVNHKMSLHQRIIIMGGDNLATTIRSLLLAPGKKDTFVGYFNCAQAAQAARAGTDNADRCGLLDTVLRNRVTKVVVAMSEKRGVMPLHDLLGCKLSGVEVIDAPTFYEELTGKIMLENVPPSALIFSKGFRITTVRRRIKRFVDVMCSLAVLLAVLPLLPIIAVAVRLDSKGKILFRQARVGEGGKIFYLNKFRSMREDAEKATGAVWSQENDPRITRVGRFLRKTRLDELPQLLNVLRGDMSLVGPRPERPEFVEKLEKIIPYYAERHFVKPGVTGWAQVCYPYGASVEDAMEKLRYDLYYIKNYSVSFDFLIMLKTLHVVLFGKGGR